MCLRASAPTPRSRRRWRTACTSSGSRRAGGPRSGICIARALQAIDFFKTRNAGGVMRTMREIAHRAPLDAREAKLLRAMAIEVTKYGERLARSGLHVDR